MITCPVCASASVVNAGRFTLTATEAAHQFILAETDPVAHAQLTEHIAALWAGSQCEMVECKDCGLGFADPFVAGDARFYNLAAHADYPMTKWEYARTIASLTQLDTTNKHGLEIGSGYGNFLKSISPRFFAPGNLLAIEYNHAAGQRLLSAGFRVEASDVRSEFFLAHENTCDFIFLFQVLEHMDQLDALANRLAFLTRQGAHIFIAVPNPARIRFNENNGSLIDAPPNHNGLWSKSSFEVFGKRMKCELVEFEVEPMSWINFLKQDLQYSHMRRAHKHDTVANWLRSKPRTTLRRLAEAMLALAWAPSRIPVWLRAINQKDSLGGSVWVHLEKH
jgi:SAM-dependent methyltransferase